MPKLKINDVEIEVAPGTSILQAAEMLGVEIPRFCYHDRLSVPANCRMCLVEVKGAPKPVASCALACGDNMEVYTASPMVAKARRGVMEMLLINHPLDCPVCDQGGECDLQDQAMAFGFDRSRYRESKRAVSNKDLGPLVKTVMTRCIQCTRCVRFSQEIAGVSDLGMINRGEDSEISTFVGKALSSELSGNLIDVCPVGALTSAPYAFAARPWELRKTESIDVHDAMGCNIRIDSRGNEVLRVLPRLHEDVNEEWLGDRSRFAVDGLKNQRLDRPWIRDSVTGQMKAVSWPEAFAFTAARLKEIPGEKISALAGDLCDLESMVALKDLMASFGSSNIDCRVDGAMIDPRVRAGYLFNSSIAGIEQADAFLLIGTNPRWEASVLNARIRKAWLASDKTLPIALVGEPADLTYPVDGLGDGPGALQALISGASPFSAVLKNAQRPMIILGTGALQRSDGLAVHKLAYDLVQAVGAVKEGWNGFNLLHTAASRVGGLDIGFSHAFDLSQMGAVYLLGVDQPGVLDRISSQAFVIYQGHHGDAGAARADVIFPGAAYTEKNGLYVNMEGRVQQARQAVHPPGDAREDWSILRALSESLGRTLPYDTPAQLRERIVREWPHFGQVDVLPLAAWGEFGHSGQVAGLPFRGALAEYYLTNVICGASPTMARCVETFRPAYYGTERAA